ARSSTRCKASRASFARSSGVTRSPTRRTPWPTDYWAGRIFPAWWKPASSGQSPTKVRPLPSLSKTLTTVPRLSLHDRKGGPMLTWVVYDISMYRTRTKIADRFLDYGLQRVQKSVFLGDIPPNRVEEIIAFSLELLNLETDAVYIFPMCK